MSTTNNGIGDHTQNTEELKELILECRICKGSEGKLVVPCSCCGTSKHVHLECLSKWIQMRPNIPDPTRRNRYVPNLKCEICNDTYNLKLKRKFNCTWRVLATRTTCYHCMESCILLISLIGMMYVVLDLGTSFNDAPKLEQVLLVVLCFCTGLMTLIAIVKIYKRWMHDVSTVELEIVNRDQTTRRDFPISIIGQFVTVV
jgi:hypothetical protein